MVLAPNTVKMLQSREEDGAEGRLGRWILELVTGPKVKFQPV